MATADEIPTAKIDLAAEELHAAIMAPAADCLQRVADRYRLDDQLRQIVEARAWLRVSADAAARVAMLRVFRADDPQALIDRVVSRTIVEFGG